MRAKDWSQTPLGPAAGWPQSLKTAVSICLGSKYPIEIWWGADYLRFYNDAYRPILGPTRHPQYLGRPGRECWGEIWDVIGPMLDSVRQTGNPTFSENLLLVMTRNGYPEETYFTFSYGALRDESGEVGGIFCACEETTREVLRERRLMMLREFAASAKSVHAAAQASMKAIASSPLDVPFALLYQIDEGRESALLLAHTGVNPETPFAQARSWPLQEAWERKSPVVIRDLVDRTQEVPAGPWPEPPHTAVIFQLGDKSDGYLDMALVLGISARRALDQEYMEFLERVAEHVGSVLTSARELEQEKKRVYELQELQERAEASNAQLIATLESITDGFITLDHEWRFTYANREAERIYGCPRSELLGKNHWEMFPDQWDANLGQEFRRTVTAQTSCHFENYYTPWQRWFEIRTYPAAAGGLSVYFRDITDRKEAEAEREVLLKKLEAERSRLTAAFMHSPAFMCILRGPEHVYEFINEEYYQLVGRRELLNRPLREALPEMEEQGFIKLLDRVFSTGEAFVGNEMRVMVRRQPDQPLEARYVDFVYQPMREPDGSISGIFVHGVDVTENKRAERALKRLAEQRRLALDSAQMGWWHLDIADDNIHWDERFRRIFGVSGEKLAYGELRERIHPDDRSRVDTAVRAATRPIDPAPYSIEYQVVHPDGSVHWVQANGQAYFEGEGQEQRAVSLVGTVTDTTEANAAEAALRESEAKFRQLADAMPQIVFMATPEGHVDYFNRQWYEYTGIPEGAVGFESWKHVHEPGTLARVIATWAEAVRTGHPYEMEYRLRRADGAFRWHLGRALPVRGTDGSILRWFGTNTDIHDYKQLQEQNERLLESERAARSEAERAGRMKDEFLATLSHELRTPLNAILGWAQLLQDEAVDAEDLKEGMNTIERNARAQKQIIEDLLDMSRIISGKVRLDVQRLELAPVVEAALDTVRPAADAKGIRVQTVLDPLARPVSGDPNRLQQVFWNLLANAVKFTPRGGRIQVLLQRVNSHLEVHVIDTGEGISPEFLPHIFDRFRQADASSTRKHGGLGLGLAIVRQLVELHGGTIRAHSGGLGQGATFTVVLPLTVIHPAPEQESDRRHPTSEPIYSARLNTCLNLKGVKVLVVDDEPDARSLVKRLLENCESIVQTAGSAAEAMEMFRSERPDVLVSDIGMPGEDGYSLIRQIRALGPERGGDVPAVALTAYARAEDRIQSIRAGFQMHVAKPVEAAELLTVVESLAGRQMS